MRCHERVAQCCRCAWYVALLISYRGSCVGDASKGCSVLCSFILGHISQAHQALRYRYVRTTDNNTDEPRPKEASTSWYALMHGCMGAWGLWKLYMCMMRSDDQTASLYVCARKMTRGLLRQHTRRIEGQRRYIRS